MAGTAQIIVKRSVWTEISAAGNTGYFENNGGDPVLLRESATLPGPEIRNGHYYVRNSKEVFTLTPGLYCRIVDFGITSEEQPVLVTED